MGVSSLTLVEPVAPTRDPDDLLDSDDVQKMLKVNRDWVDNHCTRTKPLLPHVKFGEGRNSTRRFRREDILKFIDEHVVLPQRRRS